MFKINPRRLYVWVVGGGCIGLLWGVVWSEPDTGLLLGLLFGFSLRFLVGPWLWRPQTPDLSKSPRWQRLLTSLQQDPRLLSSQGQESNDDTCDNDSQCNEGDGGSKGDLEHPGDESSGPGSSKR